MTTTTKQVVEAGGVAIVLTAYLIWCGRTRVAIGRFQEVAESEHPIAYRVDMAAAAVAAALAWLVAAALALSYFLPGFSITI